MRKKAYRSVPVKQVQILECVAQLPEGLVWVGIDMGKTEIRVVLRGTDGSFLRPWAVLQPAELPLLIEKLKALKTHRKVIVALEPTGTYGDPLRQALGDAGIEVQRVSPKASSDHAEVFDGVPSQHDGKDAAVVAELAAIGKGKTWLPPSAFEDRRKLKHEVLWMDTHQDILQLWVGRLEGVLASYWPEVTRLLDLDSATLLRTLEAYGSPARLAADAEAASRLRQFSGNLMTPEKIAAVLASAKTTQGVRMTDEDIASVQRMVGELRRTRKLIDEAKADLKQRAANDTTLSRMSQVVGPATACVLMAGLGDPHDYESGPAYRKGLGLNLAERSSGAFKGHLKITKRGSGLCRRWLYFAALRMLQKREVNPWYEQKKARDRTGGRGVVAVMRKLALALHAVTTRNEAFEPSRLFPGRPPRGRSAGRQSPPLLGALPPDPRGLAHEGQGRSDAEVARSRPERSSS